MWGSRLHIIRQIAESVRNLVLKNEQTIKEPDTMQFALFMIKNVTENKELMKMLCQERTICNREYSVQKTTP
jgi:hypothetical protein